MNSVSLGDLAYSLQLRAQNVALKTTMTTLGTELATGEAADKGARLSGNFTPLAAIEHSLTLLSSYDTAIAEATLLTNAMQASLSTIQTQSADAGQTLLLASGNPEDTIIQSAGADAAAKLDHIFSALNASVGGRSLFAGAATDTPALAGAADMMSDIAALTDGMTEVTDITTALDGYFGSGGGFEVTIYQGADSPLGPLRLTAGQSLTLDVMATDDTLRDSLKGFAMASLLADGAVLDGDVSKRAALMQSAAETLLAAEGDLAALGAEIGTAQERIETIQTENATKRSLYQTMRNDLIGVDPYTAATELEAVQTQLETLYAITARMSRLSLADYL